MTNVEFALMVKRMCISGIFSREAQHSVSQGRSDPESGVPLELVQDRCNLRDEPTSFGLEKNPKHANGAQPQANSDFVTAPLVHENCIRVDFQCQSQSGAFAGIKPHLDANRLGNHRNPLLLEPVGQSQPVESGNMRGEPGKFSGHLRRDHHFPEKAPKQFDLPDATQVQEHGSVRDDDHFGNRDSTD